MKLAFYFAFFPYNSGSFQEEYAARTKEEPGEILSLEEEQALRLTLIEATQKKKKGSTSNQISNLVKPCCSHEGEAVLCDYWIFLMSLASFTWR